MATAIAVLDSELQIPWGATFELRCGVDALTGGAMFPALRKSTVRRNKYPNQDSRPTHLVKIIHGIHEQSRAHIEVQGVVNPMNPSALDSSFAIQTPHVSPDRSFLVETIVYGGYNFEELDLDDVVLTSRAQTLSETPEKFRQIYGDYFVCGSKRRYWFHARAGRYCDERGNKRLSPFQKIEWSRQGSKHRNLDKSSLAGSPRYP